MRALLIMMLCVQALFAYPLREMNSDGTWLEIELNDDGDISKLTFSDQGSVEYFYNNRRIEQIVRYNVNGEEIYKHSYIWQGDLLISDTGWFTTTYNYDQNRRVISKISPWQEDTIQYNDIGQIVRLNKKIYSYDDKGQITSESGCFEATYDDQYNLLTLNGQQISSSSYKDLDCSYDHYGRRIRKENTSYLYLGYEEVSSHQNGVCKTIKVPGLAGMIAIEIDGKPYAPITDPIGIVRKIIDPDTNTSVAEINCDIFGANLSDIIPYAYRGKRFDPETGLIYFGKRYYDPAHHRWTSPDPLGPIDHTNLYQYVYNNPLQYSDPTGCSFWGYLAGIGQITAGCAIIASGAVLEFATVGGFTIGFGITTTTGFALIGHGLAQTTRESRDIHAPKWDKNNLPSSVKLPPRFNGDDLGENPSQCPGEGFEWRGKGSPESGKGNWIHPITGEKLHPDLWHPNPKGPHWGYVDPNGIPYDLFPDGSWQ